MSDSPGTAGISFWKVCNICKKPIPFKTDYYRCSVSTCRNGGTSLYFCTVSCYDGHLGFSRHRNSYCEEETSPAG